MQVSSDVFCNVHSSSIKECENVSSLSLFSIEFPSFFPDVTTLFYSEQEILLINPMLL